MQQKKSNIPASRIDDAEELRYGLQQLVRQVGALEEYHAQDGEPLPSSYARALMVLLEFDRHSQQPTLTDLVELLNIDKSNVTRLCQKMKDAGHIIVVRDPEDRRAKRISLSPDGLELAHFVNESSLDHFRAVIDSFDPSDRHRILDSLERLTVKLEG